jgi:hypothetical protein
MEYNDINIIKPVEGLDNIASISASGDRQEKKRRQQLRKPNRSTEQFRSEESGLTENAEPDKNRIDYTA